MDLTLRVWRQAGPGAEGRMETHEVNDISPDMSFLEMLDVVDERLMERGEVPIAALCQPLVDYVEHLQERHVRADVACPVFDHAAGGVGTRLAPHA